MANDFPLLNIVLFNVDGDNGVRAKDRYGCMNVILDRILAENYPNLFILANDKINKTKHRKLCEKLHWQKNTTTLRKIQAGVYFDNNNPYYDLGYAAKNVQIYPTVRHKEQAGVYYDTITNTHYDVSDVDVGFLRQVNNTLVLRAGLEAGRKALREADRQACLEAGLKAGFQAGLEAGLTAVLKAVLTVSLEAGLKAALEASLEAGLEDGLDAVLAAGLEVGLKAGLDAGREAVDKAVKEADQEADLETVLKNFLEAGLEVGRKAGLEVGRKAGLEVGRKAGLAAGLKAGLEDVLGAVQEAGLVTGNAFTITRLTACVLTPRADIQMKKILLVSWHGPHKVTREAKQACFKRLLRFLERLKADKSCDMVIVGGDFNLPSGNAREMLDAVGGAVLDDHTRTVDRPVSDPIDYVVYWPRGGLQGATVSVVMPDFRRKKGKRPFDHNIVLYRFDEIDSYSDLARQFRNMSVYENEE